ncbi:rRNA-processing protein [Hanseniaspora uvarum]|nr:rRNA-processing protein [Hanseniaspora uvarum]
MISSTSWVSKGFPQQEPVMDYEVNDNEMNKINEMMKLSGISQDEDLEESEKPSKDDYKYADDEDLKKFNMDDYDDEPQTSAAQLFGSREFDKSFLKGANTYVDENGETFVELPKVSGTGDNEGDEYDEEFENLSGDDDDEKDDMIILPTDNLILASRTDVEGDLSFLEVYLFDEGETTKDFDREGSLYVHHDVMLPAFPLAVEWINYTPTSINYRKNLDEDRIGNFAAVATFEPTIEVWDLDVPSKTIPTFMLKGHKGAVLSLSHNPMFRNVLVSGGSDGTIRVWDLNEADSTANEDQALSKGEKLKLKLHGKSKISSVKWLKSGMHILSAGYDSRIVVCDVSADKPKADKSWKVPNNEEIESIELIGADEKLVLIGTDSGTVYCFDLESESGSKPLWALDAHNGGISSVTSNAVIPNLFVTSAIAEKAIKVWKIDATTFKNPKLVTTRDFGVGNILTCNFAKDFEVSGYVNVGGVSGGLIVWDLFNNKVFKRQMAEEFTALLKRKEVQETYPNFIYKYTHSNASNNEIFVSTNAEEIDEEDSDKEEELEE